MAEHIVEGDFLVLFGRLPVAEPDGLSSRALVFGAHSSLDREPAGQYPIRIESGVRRDETYWIDRGAAAPGHVRLELGLI